MDNINVTRASTLIDKEVREKEDEEIVSDDSSEEIKQSLMIVSDAKIDPTNNRFPCCIVWTPLPIVSWLLPFIGHTGICDAEGVIYDFAGDYTVSRDDFAFGKVHKYFKLDIPVERT